uniref:Beta-catenin-like protein 1 n=1 Tax=Dermatophagoides pteronyssinus TaxID=6956 RepID=A0A6P6YLD9_DERPT|nr:beta-catenin-like protein 1 [Dermatophagoides pteronyssinus]
MNIEEVLRYNPPTSSFSTTDENDNNESQSTSKPKRLRLDDNPTTSTIRVGHVNAEEIDKLLSKTGIEHVNEIDSETFKRLILQLERRQLKNQEMRIKHADNPTKFMDSEFELFDIIKEMHVISTQPSLYDTAIQMNLLPQLLGLLSHENTDIACSVVALIQELTDLDDVDEIEQVGRLMDALIDGQITVALVANMERLDENVREESEGIYNSLAIIENLTDYKPELSKDVKPLLLWLLRKLKSKSPIFSANKLYASEILSILLQNSSDNRSMVGTLNGIDILLHVLSYYKRHDPSTADEEEYVENLYDCLCCSLFMSSRNLELFIQAEGIELMVLILKEKRKKHSPTDVRIGALKLLSHCFSHVADDPTAAQLITTLADKFIEILGLRVLMPIFLRPSSIIGHVSGSRRRKQAALIDQIEEHTLVIIGALLKFTSRPELRDRILNKFIEQNFVKTERLVELHLKYWERLRQFDDRNKTTLSNQETVEQWFLIRLNEGGLFILQLIDQIIVMISSFRWESSQPSSTLSSVEYSIKQRIHRLLNMHSNTQRNLDHVQVIKSIVTEYIEEKNEKNNQTQDDYLLKCTQSF